jgi:hypothetical protein
MSSADITPADNPDETLRNAVAAIRYFDSKLPDSGYVLAADDPAARLYVRRSNDRIVAAIAIVRGQPGSGAAWIGGGIAACEPSEFDPTVTTGERPFGAWLDAEGEAVPSSTLGARADCYGGTQVRYDGRLYVRIPHGGVDESQLEVAWRADVALPANAVDTGLRSGGLRLYTGPHRGALYVANGDRAERLPHIIGDEVLRTDCN